ncbi:hypothetical protein DRJ17_05065 [Candidatus Woesearchaeota archaeon]|nr:MAG: hypothetical protein DRJ17_05065 [Candidatus Woesearchaeota archaeon]
MRCSAKDLKKALDTIGPAVSKAPHDEKIESDFVRVVVNSDHTVDLYGASADIIITTRIGCTADKPFEFIVKATQFKNIVSRLPGEISIVKRYNEVSIKSSRSEYVINSIDIFPDIPKLTTKGSVTANAGIAEGILKRVKICALPKPTKPELHGVMIHIGNEFIEFCATDAVRVAYEWTEAAGENRGAGTISLSAAKLIEKFCKDASKKGKDAVVHFTIGKRYLLFVAYPHFILAKLIEKDRFLDIGKLVPKTFSVSGTVSVNEIISSLNQAENILRDSVDPGAVINIMHNPDGQSSLTVEAKNEYSRSKMTESIDAVTVTGKTDTKSGVEQHNERLYSSEVKVNAGIIKDMISVLGDQKDSTVTISLPDHPALPVVIESPKHKNYRGLIMGMIE